MDDGWTLSPGQGPGSVDKPRSSLAGSWVPCLNLTSTVRYFLFIDKETYIIIVTPPFRRRVHCQIGRARDGLGAPQRKGESF
jgi:hypothetical protein